MNGLPYYKAYPRDFMEGTIGMSFELKGAYRLILDLIYMQGGQLPDDARYIAALLGCSTKAWNVYRVKLIEMGKVRVCDGFLRNDRADAELESLAKVSQTQREKRLGKRKNNDLPELQLNQPEPEPEPEPEEASANAAASGALGALEPQQPRGGVDDPRSWTDDRLWQEVLAAVGLQTPPLPTHWQPPGAIVHVGRWRREWGLDPSRIVDAARQSRAQHADPPRGPKALDGVMQRLAAELRGGSAGASPPADTRQTRMARWERIAAEYDDEPKAATGGRK